MPVVHTAHESVPVEAEHIRVCFKHGRLRRLRNCSMDLFEVRRRWVCADCEEERLARFDRLIRGVRT